MSGGLLFPSNLADTASGSAQSFTSNVSAPALIAAGLTGATAASRYAGATTSGAPASGTFLKGDFIVDQTGTVWVCTTAGTPGSWTQITASTATSATTASGAPPTGGAGGSLGGTYPSPTVVTNANLTGDVTSVGNATTLANTANVQSVIASNIPAGSIWDFAGSSAPTGWLICDGSSQLRASFATLFAVIGTTYGSVDGTHFSLPDLRGRVSLGVGSVGTHTQPTKALATTGGSDAALLTHTHTGPSHSHGGGTGNDSPDHAHTESYFPSAFGQPWDGVTAGPGGIMSGAGGSTASGQVTQGANARHAHSISADGTGPTGAPNISTTSDSLSPFIALNKIIKT